MNRLAADEQGEINQISKYPKRKMVGLEACKNGLTAPVIFKPAETLFHHNYIEVVLPHARYEEEQLFSEDFIY